MGELLTKVLLETLPKNPSKNMILMEIKIGAKTIDCKVLGNQRNRESLPFQALPSSV